MELNEITGKIIELSIKVHSGLGSGMLENAYEACLLYELLQAGLKAESQIKLPIVYRGISIEAAIGLICW